MSKQCWCYFAGKSNYIRNLKITLTFRQCFYLQCFDAVGWAAGRASNLYKTEWWGAGVVICLRRGADLHMSQLMPLPLTISYSSKSRLFLVLPFWYRITWVVPDKVQWAMKRL